MSLFARIDYNIAEGLMENWSSHRWYKKSVYFLLNKSKNKDHIKNIPINPGLLESVKKNGFESPFLVLNSWYPICGSQRLRVAQEMPLHWQKQTKVWVCKFDNEPYKALFYWPNKQEGHEATQRFFQMCEVVFKTLYMPKTDSAGKAMVEFEEEGNQLHWPNRDGAKNITSAPPSKKKMVIPKL